MNWRLFTAMAALFGAIAFASCDSGKNDDDLCPGETRILDPSGGCCDDNDYSGFCDYKEPAVQELDVSEQKDVPAGTDVSQPKEGVQPVLDVYQPEPDTLADILADNETPTKVTGRLAFIEDGKVLVSTDTKGEDRKILYTAESPQIISTPEWRNVQEIYFVLSQNGKSDIWHKNLESGVVKNITNTLNFSEKDPSVQENYMVYASDEAGSLDIWLLDLISGQKKALTSGPEQEYQPALSPDLGQVVYVTDAEGYLCLASRDISGGSYEILTEEGIRPVFTRFGQTDSLYFLRKSSEGYEIMDSWGSEVYGDNGHPNPDDSKFGIDQAWPVEHTLFYIQNKDVHWMTEDSGSGVLSVTPFVEETDVTLLNK